MKFTLRLLLLIFLTFNTACTKKDNEFEMSFMKLSREMQQNLSAKDIDEVKYEQIVRAFQLRMIKLINRHMPKASGDQKKMMSLLKVFLIDVKNQDNKFDEVFNKFDAGFIYDFAEIKSADDVKNNARLITEFENVLTDYNNFFKNLSRKIKSESKALRASSRAMQHFCRGLIRGVDTKEPAVDKLIKAYMPYLKVLAEFNSFLGEYLGKVTFENEHVVFESNEETENYNKIIDNLEKQQLLLDAAVQEFIESSISHVKSIDLN